ncbi:unnamed protein product, partial [Amoebophrya sp. A25]
DTGPGARPGTASLNPLKSVQRAIIDPTSGKNSLGYSLWNFLQSNAQRLYRLDLSDPGERAILYLLLQLRDQLPKGCASFHDDP